MIYALILLPPLMLLMVLRLRVVLMLMPFGVVIVRGVSVGVVLSSVMRVGGVGLLAVVLLMLLMVRVLLMLMSFGFVVRVVRGSL